MKIIKDEYNYNVFYEVDDLSEYGDELTLKDFHKIKQKKICFVNDDYDLFIVELNKSESFYKYDNNDDLLLLVSNGKYFETNWGGKIFNVMETSADDYDIEMLDKIRKNDVVYFVTQF